MKIERIVAILFLVLFGITALSGYRYISSLSEQNNSLAISIDGIMERIKNLEADNTMQKIVFLKKENWDLKTENKELKTQLSRLSREQAPVQSQEIKKQISRENPVAGNGGFLLKNGAPTR